MISVNNRSHLVCDIQSNVKKVEIFEKTIDKKKQLVNNKKDKKHRNNKWKIKMKKNINN